MSELGFSKKNRLLKAADFQPVFKTARFKVSSKNLLVLAVDNNLPVARVGLVVGKKHVRLATQRNRIKRLLRESFRHYQHSLAGLDIVLLVRGPMHLENNARTRQTVDTLWSDLNRRRQKNAANKPGPVPHAE